jgi:hypothetical protein
MGIGSIKIQDMSIVTWLMYMDYTLHSCWFEVEAFHCIAEEHTVETAFKRVGWFHSMYSGGIRRSLD